MRRRFKCVICENPTQGHYMCQHCDKAYNMLNIGNSAQALIVWVAKRTRRAERRKSVIAKELRDIKASVKHFPGRTVVGCCDGAGRALPNVFFVCQKLADGKYANEFVDAPSEQAALEKVRYKLPYCLNPKQDEA